MKMGLPQVIALLSCLLPICRGADSLDQWTWRNPLPQGNDLSDVCYGNGKFVAVGISGTILTSDDGATWTLRNSGARNEGLNAVAYLNGRFVVVGTGGTILTSSDGVTWTSHYTGTSDWLWSVTYGSGQFVAVGDSGTVVTSADGAVWSKYGVAPGLDHPFFEAVTFANGQFVGVGSSLGLGGTGPIYGGIWTSTDAVIWTARDWWSGGATSDVSGIAYGAGKFVAAAVEVNLNTEFLTSADGINWTVTAAPTTYGLKVSYSDAGFLAVGTSGRVLTSEDGIGWSQQVVGTLENLYGAAHGNGLFVVVGSRGTILTSIDSVIWNRRNTGATDNLGGIAYGNGRFIAVGGSVTLTSPDGATWSRQNVLTNMSRVCFGVGRFVAVGNRGAIATSLDGKTWTLPNSPTTSGLAAVTRGDLRFVEVGDGIPINSVDGYNWALSGSTGYSLNDVAFGNGQFVAVGYLQGWILTSPDGVTWTSHYAGILGLEAIAFGNGQFVGVGFGVFWTSTDGTNWTMPASPTKARLTTVAFGGGQFVAAGFGAIVSSADGVNWVLRRDGGFYAMGGVAYGNGTFVTSGTSGSILQSGPFNLRMGPIQLVSVGLVQGTVTGPIGQNYIVEVSTNMINWTALTNLITTNANTQFLDPQPASLRRRFYRAVAPPP